MTRIGWLATLALVAPAAGADEKPALDYTAWRTIVAHGGQRLMPFDTLARETVMELTGKQSFKPATVEGIGPQEIVDWPALAAGLAAPDPSGERGGITRDDRIDRFKTGQAGDPSPLQRVRDQFSPEARRILRDVDFTKEKELWAAAEKAREALQSLRRRTFEVDWKRRTLGEVRAAATAAKDTEGLGLFAAYDEAWSAYVKVQNAKAVAVRQLNALLGFVRLYEPTFWVGARPTEEAEALIKKGVPQLPAHELARLNRLLLSQAFPSALKPAPKLGTRDPVAEKKYDPVELYLTWLFTWQGWDQLESGAAASWNLDERLYWNVHKGDGWDRTPILSSGYIDLLPLLQPETEKSVSADTPAQNASFVNWLGTFATDLEGIDGKAAEKYFEALSEAERRGFRTAQNAGTFRSLRQGLHLKLGPPEDADHKAGEPAPRWLPLFRLLMPANAALKSPYTEKSQEQIRKSFLAARKAFLTDDAAAFASASKEFAAALESATGPYAKRLESEHEAAASNEGAKTSAGGLAIFDWLDSGKKWDSYPSQKILDLEVHYNRFEPCTKAAILAFLAAAIIGLSMAFRSKVLYAVGYAGLFGTLGLMAYAMYLRSTISGRAPVSNMYETIIWASFIAGSLGSILGLVYRGRKVLPLVATLLLGLSNLMVINLPPVMGSNITPLMAVLRSQKWLVVHVMTIVASYGAFMLAWLLSLFGLAHYFRANPDPAETKLMGRFAYLSMQVGVLLLATGTWLGGVWAKDSWGRFWGWDPKEVWALIALIAYLIVLHLRFVGVKAFGTMVGSSLAFTMVVASWYGVNFLFPGGLHAYAINTGGQMFVISGVIANLAYVGAVLFARRMHRMAAARGAPSETTKGLENLAD